MEYYQISIKDIQDIVQKVKPGFIIEDQESMLKDLVIVEESRKALGWLVNSFGNKGE